VCLCVCVYKFMRVYMCVYTCYVCVCVCEFTVIVFLNSSKYYNNNSGIERNNYTVRFQHNIIMGIYVAALHASQEITTF
jgi:hypothetical protein